MIGDFVKSDDWKTEKHVPVIEYAKTQDAVEVEVSVGKSVPHPNTPEHHIAWISLYFLPEGAQYLIQIGKVEFSNHTEPLVEPKAKFYFKTNKKGRLIALSYCNLHGLWEGSTELK